jgi:hypothetical protein
MKLCLRAFLLIAAFASIYTPAQAPPEWHDDLVENMAGVWTIEGQVLGRETHHGLVAEWVLNHQFLRLHEKTAASAQASERALRSDLVSRLRCSQ